MSEVINNKQKKKSKFKIPESPFINYLEDLVKREDRGALAMLRRGLQYEPGTCIEMYPYIIPWIKNVKTRWERNIHFLISALFAYHPNSTYEGDMGNIFRKISLQRGENNSIEQRFITLIKSNPEDLAFHLRQAISLAKSANVAIPWNDLFYDLKRWPYESNFPPYEKWAKSFWKQEKKENNE